MLILCVLWVCLQSHKASQHELPGPFFNIKTILPDLCMHPANERRRYIVTSCLIGWLHTQNDPCTRIPMIKIRQSWDCLIFIMGIATLVRQNLYIEMAPRIRYDAYGCNSFQKSCWAAHFKMSPLLTMLCGYHREFLYPCGHSELMMRLWWRCGELC